MSLNVDGVNADRGEMSKTRGEMKVVLSGCSQLGTELPAEILSPGSGSALARQAGGSLVAIAQLGNLGEESQKAK